MNCCTLVATVMGALIATHAFAQDPAPLVVCDFDTVNQRWRSKFSKHEVVEVERDGVKTRAVSLAHDLSQAPNYDWLRAMVPGGVDVRPYKYLNVQVWSDDNGARLTAMMIQVRPDGEGGANREHVAAASNHPIALDFEGWRHVSIPLAVFTGLDEIAERVEQFNVAMPRPAGEAGPGTLTMDDLTLSTEPLGDVVPERVPYPPADIAIQDEAEFFGLLDLDLPALAEVRAAVAEADWPAAKQAWARHLETRETPVWTWSRRDKDAIAAIYEEKFGGLERNVRSANTVLERDFNWLGVRKQLDHDIEWLQGPVEWTHVLSRHGYWKTLGYAYWATGEELYAEDWVYMLKDWIADNPVPRILTNSRGKRGTVWRTLETGIRGDVWFDVMELFMDAPAFDAEAKYLITRSLVEHARHLHRYTVAFRYGNWQVVECTGLAAIGIMLPEFKEAASWRERAFDYLVKHMERDVYPDGAHHELTPGYHGWVMERFLKASLIANINGYDVPGLMDRHEKMFEFLMYVSKPDRCYPPLGDAGSGGSVEANMGLGALLYNRPDMRYLGAGRIQPNWVWLFGPEVEKRYADIEATEPDFLSSMLPSAQYCMMRTGWKKGDRALLFDCAPWGGGHSHQDRLQVILYSGRKLVIDPGMYSYDQPLSRTYLRKTEAHNVLQIDGNPQITSDPEVIAWATNTDIDFAAGRIKDDTFAHERSVLFVKPDYAVVVDRVTGPGEHELTRLFHFPLVDVRSDTNSAWTRFEDGDNARVISPGAGRLEMRKGWVPTGGASAEEAPVAAFIDQGPLPLTLITVLVPYADESEIPNVEQLSTAQDAVARVRLTYPNGQTDEIAIAPEPTDLTLGEQSGHGRALCIRQGPRANAISVIDGDNVVTGQ